MLKYSLCKGYVQQLKRLHRDALQKGYEPCADLCQCIKQLHKILLRISVIYWPC